MRGKVTVQKTTALGDNREGPAFDPDSVGPAASSAVFLRLPTCGKARGEEAVSALIETESETQVGETERRLGLMWGSSTERWREGATGSLALG